MKLDVFSRIMKRVKRTDTCWLWMGYRNACGYGQIGIGQLVVPVHRAMFAQINGKIPQGALVCHKCDNPPCVNPDHLWLGTHQENADDMKIKGRQKKTINSRKLSDVEIISIFKSQLPRNVLSQKHNISYQQVRAIQLKKCWKHLTENIVRRQLPKLR